MEGNNPELNNSPEPSLEPEMIELSLSYRRGNADHSSLLSNPKVRVYASMNGSERPYGETEVVKGDPEPDFSTTFTMYYRFEQFQSIRFEVSAQKETGWVTISNITTTLGEILCHTGNSAIFKISQGNSQYGNLLVRGRKANDASAIASLEIAAVGLKSKANWVSAGSYYFIIQRETQNSDWKEVYRSELIKRETSPKWNRFTISMQSLCDNDPNTSLRLDIYVSRMLGEKLSGQCEFTVNDITGVKKRELVLKRPNKPKEYGTAEITKLSVMSSFTLIDYLKEGLQVSPLLAIDLSSNRLTDAAQQKEGDELNFNKPRRKEYELVIHEVLKTLVTYNHDKRISLSGFGGKIFKSKISSMYYPFNGDETNSWVNGLQGVSETMNTFLTHKIKNKTSYLQKTLEKALSLAKESKSQGSKRYIILTVVTEDSIHDVDSLTKILAEGEMLPLSVVILGIGKENFDKLRALQKRNFLSSIDVKNHRSFVQFFSLNDLDNNVSTLIQEGLKEIPRHILEYMRANGINSSTEKERKIRTETMEKLEVNEEPVSLSDSSASQLSLSDVLEKGGIKLQTALTLDEKCKVKIIDLLLMVH